MVLNAHRLESNSLKRRGWDLQRGEGTGSVGLVTGLPELSPGDAEALGDHSRRLTKPPGLLDSNPARRRTLLNHASQGA